MKKLFFIILLIVLVIKAFGQAPILNKATTDGDASFAYDYIISWLDVPLEQKTLYDSLFVVHICSGSAKVSRATDEILIVEGEASYHDRLTPSDTAYWSATSDPRKSVSYGENWLCYRYDNGIYTYLATFGESQLEALEPLFASSWKKHRKAYQKRAKKKKHALLP